MAGVDFSCHPHSNYSHNNGSYLMMQELPYDNLSALLPLYCGFFLSSLVCHKFQNNPRYYHLSLDDPECSVSQRGDPEDQCNWERQCHKPRSQCHQDRDQWTEGGDWGCCRCHHWLQGTAGLSGSAAGRGCYSYCKGKHCQCTMP